MVSVGMLYLTPGLSHSRGQESTEEGVTLFRHCDGSEGEREEEWTDRPVAKQMAGRMRQRTGGPFIKAIVRDQQPSVWSPHTGSMPTCGMLAFGFGCLLVAVFSEFLNRQKIDDEVHFGKQSQENKIFSSASSN